MAFDLAALVSANLPAWAFVASSALYVGRDILTQALKYRRSINRNRTVEVIEDVHDVYEQLQTIASAVDGCMGVWMLRAENGGNIPTVGKDLTSSIVYEICGPDVCSAKPKWSRQILDTQHMKLLRNLHHNGPQWIQDPIPNGAFEVMLTSMGVGSAYLREVYSTEGAYYYMAVLFIDRDPVDPNSAEFKDRTRAAVSAMSQRFKKWHSR